MLTWVTYFLAWIDGHCLLELSTRIFTPSKTIIPMIAAGLNLSFSVFLVVFSTYWFASGLALADSQHLQAKPDFVLLFYKRRSNLNIESSWGSKSGFSTGSTIIRAFAGGITGALIYYATFRLLPFFQI